MSYSLRFFIMTKRILVGIAILLSAPLLQAADVPTPAGILTGDFMSTAEAITPITDNVPDTLTLQEVTVNAVFSSPKNSPLRLSEIDSETLKARASSRTYPELELEKRKKYAG